MHSGGEEPNGGTRRRRPVGLAAVALLLLVAALGPAALQVVHPPVSAAGVPSPGATTAVDPVRIMAYGDSITSGSGGDHTWRYFLDRHLNRVGQAFDLVGPESEVHPLLGRPWANEYAAPDFDTDHAGYWGGSLLLPVQSGPVDPGPAVLVAEHRPEVAVIAVGSNDVGYFRVPVARTIEMLKVWVEAARAVEPSLAVVLAESPLSQSTADHAVALDDDVFVGFNRALPALVEELDLPGAPAVLAETADGFVPSTGPGQTGDTWDAYHPNARGAQKFAAAVADALAELGVGVPYPRPLAWVPEGPSGALTLTRGAAGPRARLHWNSVDGATDVRIEQWQQETGAGAGSSAGGSAGGSAGSSTGEWREVGLISTFTGFSTTLGPLDPCARHRLRARALKQWTVADERYASAVIEWSATPTSAPGLRYLHWGGTTTVAWDPVPGACSYRVVVGADGDQRVVEAVTGTSEVKIEIPTPAPGVDVLVRVEPQGVDAGGPAGTLVLRGPAWPTPTPHPIAEPTPSVAPTSVPSVVPPLPSPPVPVGADGPVAVRGVDLVSRGRRFVVISVDVPTVRPLRHQVQIRTGGGGWRSPRTWSLGPRNRLLVWGVAPGRRHTVRVRVLAPATTAESADVLAWVAGPWSAPLSVRTRR